MKPRKLVLGLELLMQFWQKYSYLFVTQYEASQKIAKSKKLPNPPFPDGISFNLAAIMSFQQFVLETAPLAEDYEYPFFHFHPRIKLQNVGAEEGISEIPFSLWAWNAFSRREYQIENQAEIFSERKILGELLFKDLFLPFPSFLLTLENPLPGPKRESFKWIIATRQEMPEVYLGLGRIDAKTSTTDPPILLVPPGSGLRVDITEEELTPINTDSLLILMINEQIEKHPVFTHHFMDEMMEAKRQKQDFKILKIGKRYLKAVQEFVKSFGNVYVSFKLHLEKARELPFSTHVSKIWDNLPFSRCQMPLIYTTVAEEGKNLVLLSSQLLVNGQVTTCQSDTPERKDPTPDNTTVTSKEEIFSTTRVYRIGESQPIPPAKKETGRENLTENEEEFSNEENKGSTREMPYHQRAGHLRRPKNTPLDHPKTVKVRPTEVRPDRKPPDVPNLSGGSMAKVKK